MKSNLGSPLCHWPLSDDQYDILMALPPKFLAQPFANIGTTFPTFKTIAVTELIEILKGVFFTNYFCQAHLELEIQLS